MTGWTTGWPRELTRASVHFPPLRRDVATAGSVGRGLPAPAAPLRGALPPHNPCMLLMQPRVLLLPPLPIPNPTAAFAAADGIAETEHSLTHIRAPAPTAAPTAVASPDVSPAGPDSTYIPAIPIRRLRPPSFLPTPAPAPTPDPTSALTASPTASPTAAHEAPAPTALPAHVANASGEPCLPARVPLSVLVSCPASDCLVEPEVLVRGQGMYLPATARLLCAPAGMDHAADSAAGPDVNGTACHEVVLWGLPPRPGVVLVSRTLTAQHVASPCLCWHHSRRPVQHPLLVDMKGGADAL